MKKIDKRSLLLGSLLPVALMFLMGAAGVLSRYHTIEAQNISLVDENGDVITTLSDLSNLIEEVESFDGLVDKKIRDIKQAVNDAFEVEFRVEIDTLSSKFSTLQNIVNKNNDQQLDVIKEFDALNNSIAKAERGLNNLIEDVEQEIDDLEEKHIVFKKKTDRKIKDLQYKQIARIENKLESLDEMENKIDILMKLKSLQKEIQKVETEEAKNASKSN